MKSVKLCSIIVGLVTVLACGGGGGGGLGGGTTTHAGVFRGTLSRAGGDILLQVNSNRSVSVVVNDTALGSFTGQGQIDDHDAVTATVSKGAQSLSVTATIAGTGTSATVNGSVSGAFSATFAGGYVSSNGQNPFAGNYSGTFAGGSTGTWTATVAANGDITAQSMDGFGTYNHTGHIDNLGTGSFSGTGAGGGVTVSFSGQFRFGTGSARTVSGTWASSAPMTGTFTGQRN